MRSHLHHEAKDGAPMAPRLFLAAARGWTLLELVIALAIGSVLVYVAVRTFHPQEAIALEQAERLRNDLRHLQMLAITWGQPLRVTTAATSYSVSCASGSAIPPCNGASPVIDPATRSPYTVNLESGLSLGGPGFTLDLDALGRPLNGGALITGSATFTISGGGVARTVTVAPVTGFATAQ